MDELLTPVSTTYLKSRRNADHHEEPFLTEVKPDTKQRVQHEKPSQITTPDEALETLKGQPDYDALIGVLIFLTRNDQPRDSEAFHIHSPGPKSAAIVHVLITEIIPNYWTILSESDSPNDSSRPRDAVLLVRCLQSVTGLNALLVHIKALIQESRTATKDAKRPDIALNAGIFLDLLAAVLEGSDALCQIWTTSTARLEAESLKKAQSQAFVGLVAGGRITSLVAEAQTISQDHTAEKSRWMGDGIEFSRWIARSLVSWSGVTANDTVLRVCSDLAQRAMSLGYFEHLTRVLIDNLLLVKTAQPSTFAKICFQQVTVTKKVLQILISYLSQRFLNPLDLDSIKADPTVSAAAGVIASVVGEDGALKSHLVNWAASSSGAGLGDGVGIRRAMIAVIARDRDTLTKLLERSLGQFGDELYIKHAAILQQQVHTEVLLLAAGYLQRASPLKLSMLLRSSEYLRAISNRIAATQVKARLLGMVVGESLSSLSETKTKPLHFQMEETDTEEAQALKDLTTVSDQVGPTDPLQSAQVVAKSLSSAATKQSTAKHTSETKRPKQAKPPVADSKPKAIIEELDSEEEDSDDEEDLVPYVKDSDPEDSDDDPTMIQRNKVRSPVYVRDLISFFRDSENYDKQKLALQTAPVLIRRKANFGTEVSSHAVELARLLVGAQDKFELDDFAEQRQQGIMALLVAQPRTMGPWFARTFFEGDYSLAQRTAVLVALGLSARELAGFDASEYESAAAFPSKRLPEKMEQLYLSSQQGGDQDGRDRLAGARLKALPATALDSISQSLTSAFLAPMAAEAADANTGPDVLKLQSFTARYQKSQASKSKPRARIRSIPNTTAALLTTSLFSPLTAHFQLALRSPTPIILNQTLLSLYLQTLGIIVHAAGPSTLALPQLTAELWDLLLAARAHVFGDTGATRGWLIAMAALLEVNEASGGGMRRLCEVHGKEVVETREWVGGVFQRTRGDDGGEENDVKMLAAGVLIKLGEAIEKYQAMLMGDMIGYS